MDNDHVLIKIFNVYFCQASGSRDVKHKRSYSESRHLSQNKSQNMASSQSVDVVDGLGVEENAVSAQEIKKSIKQNPQMLSKYNMHIAARNA